MYHGKLKMSLGYITPTYRQVQNSCLSLEFPVGTSDYVRNCFARAENELMYCESVFFIFLSLCEKILAEIKILFYKDNN